MSPRDRILCMAIVIGGAASALLLYLYLPAHFPEPVRQAAKSPVAVTKPAAPATDLWSWAKSEINPHESASPDNVPAAKPGDEKSDATEDTGDDEPVDLYASCDHFEGEEAAACIERIDQRIEMLRDACDKYEDDIERWQDCMEAANQLKDY